MDQNNTRPNPSINLNPKPIPPDHQLPPKRRHLWAWLKFKHSHLNRKQKIIVSLVVAVLIIGGGAAIYAAYKHFHKPTPSSIAKKQAKKGPTTVASPLTGVQVAPDLAKRPVTGIIIENSPAARPQSGIKDAGVVYEAIAEGGITRFLTLFQEARPDYIGPVRSVRPYYLDWLLPFDASIAHVGGAPQALSDIKTLGIKDLDQFANSGTYERVRTRFAPHNVYTNFDKLDAANASKGFTSSSFNGWKRKKDAKAATASARIIDVNISNNAVYASHYDYDPVTNSYKRGQGGGGHLDERSNIQLSPKVVIVMVMSRGIASDGQHTNYATTGNGQAFIFQDGVRSDVTWSKTDRKSQINFKDSNGQDVKLNAGQTWITVVDAPTAVTSAP